MRTLILNASNVVSGTQNSKYRYNFPKTAHFEEKDKTKLCVASVNMYYSWFNISESNQNNYFQYKWLDTSGNLKSTPYTITIKDGLYSLDELNEFILTNMRLRGHFLIRNSDNTDIYFFEFLNNQNYYAVQLNMLPIPSDSSNTYTKPASPTISGVNYAWALPSSSKKYPQIIIPSVNKFYKLIGFDSTTYAPSYSSDGELKSYLSSYTPNMTPSSSIIMTCSLCKNEYSYPNNIVATFTQSNAMAGETIIYEPNNLLWNDVQSGSYSSLEVQFLDQDLKQLNIRDNQLIITILLKDIND